MFAAMAALNRRKTTLNPTTSGICLMIGSLLTRAAESNVRQGVAAVTKKRGTEAPRPMNWLTSAASFSLICSRLSDQC